MIESTKGWMGVIIFDWTGKNNEWEWWSMKASAEEICNVLNNMKIAFNWKKRSYLVVTNDVWLNQQKDEWEWLF